MTESTVTVVVAGAANLAIAVAKALAGALSGSAAMLSEAAHSMADTVTEVLLFAAVRRGARPAGFSITHGVHTIRFGETPGPFGVSYIVLAVAFVIESVSLARSLQEV